MKRILSLTLIFILSVSSFMLFAQNTDKKKEQEKRKAWLEEFRSIKRNVLIKEIGLSDEEAARFFPLDNEKETKKHKLHKENRQLTRSILKSNEKVTDAEYEKAAEALVDIPVQEAAIEKEYYLKFKQFLSKEKLFKYRQAELKFPQEMLKYRDKNQTRKGHSGKRK